MPDTRTVSRTFPRQPVLGRDTLRGTKTALPSLIDLPHVFTRSGRAAIRIAIRLAGAGPGSQVLVPTYHCPTMVAPVELVGAEPLFYPIDESARPNVEWLARQPLGSCRAMLAAHLFGITRDLSEVATFCQDRGIVLIEDCAHCFFGLSGTRPVGSTGDFAIGSLPKFFPVAEGGVLASARRPLNSVQLSPQPVRRELAALWDAIDLPLRAGRLGAPGRALRAVGRMRNRVAKRRANSGDTVIAPRDDLRTEALGDELMGPTRLRRVDAWLTGHCASQLIVESRQRNFNMLTAALERTPGIALPIPRCASDSAPYVVPVLLAEADDAYQRMRSAGLPVFRWDRLWPGTPRISSDVTADWSRGLIQVACHQSLSEADMRQIADILRACLR